MKKGKTFIISGPSGVGKSTVLKALLERRPNVYFSVSATTRDPRPGELDGIHYHFMDVESFRKWISMDQFLEYAEYVGNFYGTPKSFVEKMLADGKRVLFDLDVFGKVNFDKVYPDAVGILILPPSLQVLEERLRHRATDSEEVIELRLHNAKKEIEFAEKHGKYEHTIINDDLERAADQLRKIFLE